mgnify:CR=1 FL=1
MNVFDLDKEVIATYESFSRSFANIRAPDLLAQISKIYEDGGRSAMETLLSKDPNINVVYTINEPTAFGAASALKAAGKSIGKDVYSGSVDGGRAGVEAGRAQVLRHRIGRNETAGTRPAVRLGRCDQFWVTIARLLVPFWLM